ncbi:hypothetical protein MHSWG343_05690 [Candidatus Mycoplasma haematohominis]|uniref:Uncharacterized protein n=1 Tax=Candidatus Mycoplasma haematohominis TaxID=1494318 RepID=A0A478FQG4_9MOLU|nr:hypothetical protein MHSWG343_05690 [Candidatus Mycoplasma haemohominis]
MSLAKAAVAVGGAVLLTAGTTYGIYSAMDPMPSDFVVLSKDTNYSTTYSSSNDKVGELYGNYLISPYGLTSSSENSDKPKDNKDWWEWSYRRLKSDLKGKNVFSTDFSNSNIKHPYKTSGQTLNNGEKALNEICETVYGKTKTDIFKVTGDSDDNKENLRKDLFKYCSFFWEAPNTIGETKGESYSGNTSYGKKYESKLIGTKGNDIFWETRNKEFFEGGEGNKGIGKDLSADTDSLFHGLYSTKGKPDQGNIKETCKKAYALQEGSTGTTPKTTKGNVFKFCSLEKKEIS